MGAAVFVTFRTIDSLASEMKAKRLNLDKLVKARKESIRAEIMQDARNRFDGHMENLIRRVGNYFTGTYHDFPAATRQRAYAFLSKV